VKHNPSDRLRGLSEAEALLNRWISHWLEFGFGYWCVRETERPRMIGYCGIKVVNLHDVEVLNLMYRFTPTAWGRGIATEAASAVVTWAGENQPHRRLLARVRPQNVASQRVAVRAGLHRDPSLDDDGEDGPNLLFVR